MAPITTTTAGIARQIIDDPELVSLLERLHSLTIPSDESNDNDGDEDVVMAENDEGDKGTNGGVTEMIESLVKEIVDIPRWRFQEQADLYEWIHPLNAIDATLRHFIQSYPSLLLIPPQSPVLEEAILNSGSDKQSLGNSSSNDNNREIIPPPAIVTQLTTILTFLSTLLRNSINKSIFNSVHELSSLLTSPVDAIAMLALQCLSTLSQPPLLHRQQAPEMGGHSTQLNGLNDGGRVMQRILRCAVGWGSMGSGLGLLNCIQLEDRDLILKQTSTTESSSDGGIRGVGCILFRDCIVSEKNVGGKKVNTMVNVEMNWEDLYESNQGGGSGSPAMMGGEQLSSSSLQEEPKKRRKVAPNTTISNDAELSPSSSLKLKSTAQLFHECLENIHQQLNIKEASSSSNNSKDSNTVITLPPEKQFNLLAQIRLARSFHTSSTRISAIESRLRAVICLLSSQPNQDVIGAFFAAQPELCGELVDLVRPTVSGGNITGGITSSSGGFGGEGNAQDSILVLSDSPQVPFHIQTLAIEALTALVARRDSTGTMNTVARQVNVLSELGVGKGQYSGLLPTLIRHSLAALNSVLLCDARMGEGTGKREESNAHEKDDNVDLGQELGMIFLQCTKPPPLPQKDREERALEFIDSVLTLTSAVISVPSGTAALTDCGIIPALVSTIALDSQIVQKRTDGSMELSLFVTGDDGEKESYSECLLKYITAQAIQILEGAIVTHTSALSAFHELKGVDILVHRLHMEMERVKQVDNRNIEDEAMDEANGKPKPKRNLQAARRVLLFSAVNCLTVVFHQQEANGNNAAIPSGAAQLRKPELIDVLTDILENSDSYGAVLAGLVSTLLSDVINADAQIVHHVHKSGLAKSFLSLLMGKNNEMQHVIGDDVTKWGEIEMEPSAELVMAFPNLILALSLTESGARSIKEMNPFPALLSVFCSPKFAMPNSRCLLNEMAAIIGTGLDEIMRHNPTTLKPSVIKALVLVMNRIVHIGKQLTSKEEWGSSVSDENGVDLVTARTYLVQYSHNIAQLLEQMLHNEDHVQMFLNGGGVDALLELSRWSITPAGTQLVVHVSCLSSPSIGSVTHTNISTSFGNTLRNIASHSDSHKIVKKIIEALEVQFANLRKCIAVFRDGTATGTAVTGDDDEGEFSFSRLFQSIPTVPIHDIEESEQNSIFLYSLASLHRSIINLDWLVFSLSTTLRAATQKMDDTGSILFGRGEKEYQKQLASESFRYIINQLSMLHRSALWEVCRVRTEPGFDERDLARNNSPNKPSLVYRIRIVCQEGAICRNGIDIDGCDNIGNVEMGEIVEAYDRCINSSGVLRYKTSRGWVSELTRGHGRENIGEIIDVRRGSGPQVTFNATEAQRNLKRIECGVPDLRSVSASILARLNSSHSDLFSSFERIYACRIRSLNIRDQSQFDLPPHVLSVGAMLSENIQDDFKLADMKSTSTDKNEEMEVLNLSHDAAKCMYFGNTLNLLHTCLYSEKRIDRRGSLNIPLLLSILTAEGWKNGIYPSEDEETSALTPHSYSFMSAVEFVLKHSLRVMAFFAVKKKALREERQQANSDDTVSKSSHHQRLSRAVASSFPPTISLLQRLVSRSNILESPVSLSLAKMNPEHLKDLISDAVGKLSDSMPSFNAKQFVRALHLHLAKLSFDVFSDNRMCCAPAHALFPWISYMNTLISSLEDAAKPSPATAASLSSASAGGRLQSGHTDSRSRLMREPGGLERLLGIPGRVSELSQPAEPFEPSEESIERLTEMGFTRDHAIESLETVGSNRIDVAMEYALSHPPSSPETLARRRAAREERRQRQERLAAAVSSRRRSLQGQSAESSADDQQEDDQSTANANAAPNSSSESNDKQDEEESKPKALSDEELKAKKEVEFEEKDATRAKEYLESVKDDITNICLNIIESGNTAEKLESEMESVGDFDDGSGGGDTDTENVTVVVTSFLVDLCTRYTSDVTKISSSLLRRLKSNLRVKSRSDCQVKPGCEVNFSALVHASVIFFRSVPASKPLILRHGIISCLLHCVRNVTLMSSHRNGGCEVEWPCWLGPSLLLLELMAQPTSIPLEDENENDADTSGAKAGKKGDFARVMAQHKKQSSALAKHTKNVLTTLNKDSNSSSTKKKKGKGSDVTKPTKTGQSGDSSDCHSDNKSNKKEIPQPLTLPRLPSMLPLLHFEDAEAAMRLCLQLLGLRSARKILDPDQLERACPPPNIVHAALSLLVRVLHSQKIASSCLAMGGAEVILALPGSCRFNGNHGLVTLALRRMLEDEATLQAMMETEIRSQVTRLFKAQHRGSVGLSDQQPKCGMKAFFQKIVPLICRAPQVSVRAIACSVKMEPRGDQSSSLTTSRDARVVLLTSEERAKKSKLLGSQNICRENVSIPNKRALNQSQDDNPKHRRGQNKSPHNQKKQFDGSPPNHVVSLLLEKAMKVPTENAISNCPFLWTHDYLNILSDLILAIPACGAAIHRYKPTEDKSVLHALSGCSDPPQTAVSFILHSLVILPRTKSTLSSNNYEKFEAETPERKLAIIKSQTAQSSARLIVALVARSGEGRRRVLSDLIFAMSAGRINNQELAHPPITTNSTVSHEDLEMHALLTWAELIMGLASPRSISKTSSNSHDPNSTLSLEVVKVLLEQGAAHALMFAMEKINLSHPMAVKTVSSILRPLEIFTRSSVYTKVLEMAKKEKDSKKDNIGESKESRRMTFGPSNRSESAFADDEMLEDGFVGQNTDSLRRALDQDAENEIAVEDDLDAMEDYDDDENSESDEEDMEIRLGQVDLSVSGDDMDEEVFSSGSDIDNNSDMDSNDSESEEEDSDLEDGSEEEDEDDNQEDETEDMNMLIDGTEQEVDEGWGRGRLGSDELFDGEGVENNFEDPDDLVGNDIEEMGVEEMGEWTEVDAGNVPRGVPGGLGNMLVEALQRNRGGVGGGHQGLAAVENMLSTFLREGRISELEDTLGIRVVHNGIGGVGRSSIGLRVPSDRGNSRSLSADPRDESSTATNSVVYVHQTIAPDAGYGRPSISNRSLAETMPMEFIFGGPAAGAASEYYYSRPSARTSDREQYLHSPSALEAELFPGGLAASTQSRQSILPHPLLSGVDLPPANAILTHTGQDARLHTGNTSSSRSLSTPGTLPFTRNEGGLMRINRDSNLYDPLSQRSAATNTLSFGWLDDALPPERATEEFGPLFGQALLTANQAIFDDFTARNEDNAISDTSPAEDDPIEAEAAHEPDVSTASGGNVDVSSLTISQQETDSNPTTSNEPDQQSNSPNDVEISAAEPNNTNDAVETIEEQNDTEMVGVENLTAEEEDAAGSANEDQGEIDPVDTNETGADAESADNNDDVEADEDGEDNGPAEAENPEAGESLTCPPNIDVEVFNSLPLEMQQEICREHTESTSGIAEQLGDTSGLDPEALAALPEEMRQEIIEQERQQQQRRQNENEAAADPSNAEDMDNANFLASLAPDLRQEILLTADETFLQSLPPQIVAEANILRERVAAQHRSRTETHQAQPNASNATDSAGARAAVTSGGSRRRPRNGKLKVEQDRTDLIYTPKAVDLGPLLTGKSIKTLFTLFYLLSPIQQQKIFQKLLVNLCRHPMPRHTFISLFAALLLNDRKGALEVLALADGSTVGVDFPPQRLLGIPPESIEENSSNVRNLGLQKRNDTVSASTAAISFPASSLGLSTNVIPPVTARRMISILLDLTKSSPRFCISMLDLDSTSHTTCLDRLLELLKISLYTKSTKNLEQLLSLLEMVVSPLSLLPKDDVEVDLSSERATQGMEYVKVPRVVVSREHLQLLVNALRLESCNDASFAKVNIVCRRLSRVGANRDYILGELASVAQGLGAVAIRDLKSVGVRLGSAAKVSAVADKSNDLITGAPSSAVSLSTSNSELKFLRVLQTLQLLCNEYNDNGNSGGGNSPEFTLLVQSLDLEPLWKELEASLHLVSVLEGITNNDDVEEITDGEEQGNDDDLEGDDPLKEKNGKKLQNSVAGLIARFLPAVEAFFIVNTNSNVTSEENEVSTEEDNNRLIQFASNNKVLLNALLRSNPQLLDKGLKTMVQMPKCRPFLDFDVKRQYFKTQVRRLRQQASRRHGSLRLNLRRRHVFEDSFRAFIHRNAEELRGRLHITFQDEEGVDAGGLSREFFAILAKEMFNPNYALFMSTEDGCTFQPNPNSSINLDDLNYFRFVGRIVGKAVTDGFLLDAHFTRSLYKHMLGVKPTHHDMQAIDPDYYKNLLLILEHNLDDIGVELTFSTEDHSFGRSQVIDLIPDGRNIAVTDETKAKYVDLVCQHRMTTAIQKQIKAYLEGFHEMVDKDLISIFTAKELELLISGMPDIDIHDLKKNTDYNGYRPVDKEIGWFWNIMFSLSRSEKAAFLQFVTGSSKVPLAGFSELQGMRGTQKFSINKASGSDGALMSAHTCFNALDLPVYKSEEEMKEKLLYAISEGGGGFLFA